jgi:hypothetical protein
MSVDNFGVHASHCCVSHGCKYGDPNCPVEKGLSLGVVCEICADEVEAQKPITHLRADLSAARAECERYREALLEIYRAHRDDYSYGIARTALEPK